MRTKARTLGWILALVAVVAVISSALTTFAESRLRPQGSFRVVLQSDRTNPALQLPFLATFTGGGGVVTTSIPLTCLATNEMMSPAHGQWEVRMHHGAPTLFLHLFADVYELGDQHGASKFEGSLEINGSSPLTFGDVKGTATLSFPAGHPCAALFDGPAQFAARQIPAVQPPPNEKQ